MSGRTHRRVTPPPDGRAVPRGRAMRPVGNNLQVPRSSHGAARDSRRAGRVRAMVRARDGRVVFPALSSLPTVQAMRLAYNRIRVRVRHARPVRAAAPVRHRSADHKPDAGRVRSNQADPRPDADQILSDQADPRPDADRALSRRADPRPDADRVRSKQAEPRRDAGQALSKRADRTRDMAPARSRPADHVSQVETPIRPLLGSRSRRAA